MFVSTYCLLRLKTDHHNLPNNDLEGLKSNDHFRDLMILREQSHKKLIKKSKNIFYAQ